jgi:hypothetical protein
MHTTITIDQKREILRKHYLTLNIQLNPALPESEIEKYYKMLMQLADSERRHKETKPKLRLIKNDDIYGS